MMLRLLLALALAAPAAGQEPKSTATAVCQSATVTSPTPDNGCNFGACKSLTSDTMNCAYDSSFCDSSTEEWMTAAEVEDAGSECKCTDILNYPSNIGTCSSSGVYSPMAVASDCSGGTAVCEADTAGHFFSGDTQAGAKQFTACDLPCSNSNDHTMDIATDTYTGCEFYQTQWATIAQAATGRMYPRSMTLMGNSVLLGAQIKSTTQGTASNDFELRGPFTRADPDGSEGTSIHEDLKYYDLGGWDQYEVGLVKVDATTGAPQNIVHFHGPGRDGAWSVATNADDSKVVAGGRFSGNLTFTGLPTIVSQNSQHTGTMHDAVAMDGWVATFDSDLTPLWLKHWPKSPIGAPNSYQSPGSRCLGAAFDASGDVMAVGYECNATCIGAVSKMAGSDGTQAWEKKFTDVQSFERITMSTDGSGDFFVRGKLLTTTSVATAANPDPFGVACEASTCGLIARMTSDGALVWARTIEGASESIGHFSGRRVELAANNEPYIYLAMQAAAASGPVSLDSGTKYAGCKDDTTGVVMPAYEVSTTVMVTASDCPSGSTFVDTDSADAVWAGSANPHVHCPGNVAGGCLVKYHAFTGKPVWAVGVPSIVSINPMTDGTVHAVGYGTTQHFDHMTISTRFLNAWHAIFDAETGKAESANSMGGKTGDTYAYDSAVTADGDLIVAGYTRDNGVRFDDGFTATYPANGERNAMVWRIETSGSKVQPSCVSSCGGDVSDVVIAAGTCYINGICYNDGDDMSDLGFFCKVCDVSQSQTEMVDSPKIGVSQCFIGGECFEDDAANGPHAAYTDRANGYSSTLYSECRLCIPSASTTEWTVPDGWTNLYDPSSRSTNVPNDCECAAGEGMCDSTVSTDSGDSPDRTTAASGGTLSESDGAQALVAGALAPLAALLL